MYPGQLHRFTATAGACAGGLLYLGLIDPPAKTTLAEFLKARLAAFEVKVKAGKMSPDTLRTKRNAADAMIDFFGAGKRIQDITAADAVDFRDWLLVKGGRPVKKCGTETIIKRRMGLSEATTRLRCRHAGEFLRYALTKRLITANPFAGNDQVPTTGVATSNETIVGVEQANRILEQLPSVEWKLLFVLAKWGGLRIGSEPRRLTWDDINWHRQEFLVRCVKTQHIPGHETRIVPFFADSLLGPLFAQRFEQAAEGDTLVLPMLVGRTDSSLRKTLFRAIDKAGVPRWADLWRTLRRTRHNELRERGMPDKAVNYWLGDSTRVADKHYAHITESDNARAKGLNNPTMGAARAR